MTSTESRKYGIIDAVIEARKTKLTATQKIGNSSVKKVLEPEKIVK